MNYFSQTFKSVSRNPLFDTLKHFFNYFGSNVFIKALGLISVPILTRLLTTADYGIASVFTSYVGIFVIVLTLNSSAAIGRYYFENKDDFKDFVGTSVLTAFGCLALSLPFIIIFRRPIAATLALPEPLVLIIFMMIVFAIFNSVFSQIFYPLNKSRLIASVNSIQAVAGFVLSILFVLLLKENRYMGLIWSQLLIGLVSSVFFIYLVRQYLRLRFKFSSFQYIVIYCFPLIPYALSGIILEQFDRIMINGYRSAADVGLYSFAYNIGMLLSLFWSTLYQAWIPSYFKYMNEKDYARHDADIDKIFRLIVIAAGFLMFFGGEIGFVLSSRSFHASLHIIPIIVLGYLFFSIFAIYSRNLDFAKKTAYLSALVLASGVLNIILNAVYIPRYGYQAAAYTTMASYLFMAALAWFFSKFVIRLHSTSLIIVARPMAVLLVLFGAVGLLRGPIGFYPYYLTVKIMLFLALVAVLSFKYFKKVNAGAAA